MTRPRGRPQPRCPIRPGDACSLCQPGVTGPEDCGLVYLVRSDTDLRDRLHELTKSRLSSDPPPRRPRAETDLVSAR